MAEQDLRHREDISVDVRSQAHGARQPLSGLCDVSLREPHDRPADERFRFGPGRDTREIQHALAPLKRFDASGANQPEEQQIPCDVGRVGSPLAFDQPVQRRAVVLQIVADAIEPLDLRRPGQSRSRSIGFTSAIGRQPLECGIAFA